MKLNVRVCGRAVATLYRERDEYVLSYLPDTGLKHEGFIRRFYDVVTTPACPRHAAAIRQSYRLWVANRGGR
jgi:hypothetical protein